MLFAQFVLLAPYFISLSALAQTEPTGAGQEYGNQAVPQGAGAGTDETAQQYNEPSTTLVQQDAEQNTQNVTTEVEDLLDGDNAVTYNDVYQGLHTFWGSDIITNLFHNIGHLIGKWITEFINGWVSDAVRFLTALLRVFVLNPNIAVNGLNGNPDDNISRWIRQGADLMYAIAVDLLLLLFILCIWKYWAEAAWRGGGNLMGAIGRLIFTAGLMLAWPTIYAFEIQITNEMIKYIFFNSSDQVMQLDAAMAAAVKGGLLSVTGLIVNATAPVAGQVLGGILGGGAGGLALGTIAGGVAWAGLIVYMVLGAILITQLVYILVLKAIQTALLTAQYMFAPIFLVFFATPDTESVTSGFVRSFVEVSLWTFFWVGLLKIMVIVILSDYNPWGKLVLAVGVLQLMIKVPEFMAKAQISPASDFIRAGSIIGGLAGAAKAVGSTLAQRSQQLAGVIGGNTTTGAAPGPEQSKAEKLNGLPNGVSNQDTLGKFNSVSQGGDPNDPNGPNGPKGPKGPKGPELDENGKPITPNDKPDPNAPVPPEKKKDEDEKKKKEGGDGTGADATGKTVNTATDPLGTSVTPGTTTGTGTGATGTNANPATGGSKTATIDTSAISNTTAAIVKGAGEAAQSLDNSRERNKGTGTGTESPADRETRAAAEQLAFDFQNEKNLENAGVDEKATGEIAEASVKGKVLDTGSDKGAGNKDGSKGEGTRKDEQAKDGQLDKFAGALASQVLPSKGQNQKEAASGKGVDTPVNRNINPVDKDGRGEKDVQGELFSAQDLSALSREGVEGAVADAIEGDADGKSIDVDMDQEIADQSKATAPGGLVTGKTVVGKLASKGGNTGGKDIKTSGVVTGRDAQINSAPPKPGSISTTTDGPNAKDASSTQLEQVTSEPHMAVVDPSTGIGTDEEVKGPDLAVSATPLNSGSSKGLNLTIDPKALVAGGQGGVKSEVTGSLKTDGAVADNSGTPQIKTDVQGKVLSQGGGDKIAAVIGTPQSLDAGMTADAQGLKTDDVTMTADGKIVESSGQMRFNFGPSIQSGGKTGGPSVQGDVKADLTTSADGSQAGSVDATLKTDAKIVGDGGKGQVSLNATETLTTDNRNVDVPEGATLTADGKIVESSGQMRFNFAPPSQLGRTPSPQNQTGDIKTDTPSIDAGSQTGGAVDATLKTEAKIVGEGGKGQSMTVNATETLSSDGAMAFPDGATLTADGKIVEPSGQIRLPFPHVVPGGTKATTTPNTQGVNIETVDSGTPNPQDASASAKIAMNAPGTGARAGEQTINVDTTSADTGAMELPAGATITADGKTVEAGGQMRLPFSHVASQVKTGAQDVRMDGNTGNVQDGATSTANVRLNASGKPGEVTTNVEGTVLQQDEQASPQQVQLTQEAARQAAQSQPVQVSMAPPTRGVNTGSPQVKLDASGQPVTGDNAQMNVSGRVLGGNGGGTGGGNGSGGPPGDPPVNPPDPSEGGTPGPDSPYLNMYNTSNDQKPFSTYQQAGYRWIGPRTIAGNIRLAKDTTLGPSTSGEAELLGNGKGQTFHVRTGRDASEEQIAMQMMTAGYAQYVGSDPVAYDAARSSAMESGAHKPQNWKERMAAGIMTYNGGSWSQTAVAKQRFQQAMYSQAVQGSQAYVLNQPGNAYTEYLNDRFGPMDEEQQAMGAFIMSNAGSPESAWNWKHIPATESLVQNAIPISGMSRAVASHMNIMRAQPWAKGHRIRGGVAYMNARMAEELPGVSPMSGVATVWAGREAQIMPNEVVDTVGALAHEFGETACQNVALVNRIATEVGAGKDPEEYSNAYRAMTGMANAGNAARQRVQQIVQGQVIRTGGAPSMASSVSLGGQTYMNDVPVEVELVDSGAHAEPELPGNLSQIAGAAAVAGGHQQTRASVHVTNAGSNASSAPPARKIRLNTTLHDSTPQMEARLGSYNGPSNSGQVVETRVEAELLHSGRSTDYGSLDENELTRDAASFVGQFNDTAQMAYRVVHDLHAAGFSYEQLADPKVAQTALRVYAQDPSMAPAAAIALNKVGAENFSVERTHVVQTMLDTDPDWGQHNIDSKSIYTAEAIMRVTSSIKEQEDSGSSLQSVSPYPTRSFVKQVGLVRAFQARAQEPDQGYDQSIVDVIRRKMENRAKGYDREYSGLEDNNGRTA